MPIRHSAETQNPQKPEDFRASWLVFWIAFAVRVLYMTLAHTYRLHPEDEHMEFGYEMGRIARALATGFGYSDPFRGHTGPTAWVAPLYPLLLGGVFKLFGVFTLKSAWVILTINSFFSALTVPAIWEIGARCFDRNVARWSAWIWALYPAAMQYAVRWVWEMSLSTMLFAWLLVLTLRLRDEGGVLEGGATASSWARFGLLWGLVGLSNPVLLIVLPVCGLWALKIPSGRMSGPPSNRHKFILRHQANRIVLAGVIFTACLAPWIVRNWLVFHHFVPTRANFGAELYLGNGPGATGFLMEYDHPIEAPDQLRLYKALGEVAYARMRGTEAMAFIHADPGLFARNTFKRFFFFWVSVPHAVNRKVWVEYARSLNFLFASLSGLLGLALALRRKRLGAGLFAWAFVLVPLVYYVIAAHARFRNPLEPLLVVLGVYLFQSAEPRWTLTKRTQPRKIEEFGTKAVARPV